MLMNPVSHITRQATRQTNEMMRCLTAPTHERYESLLARTNVEFHALQTPQTKDWKEVYAAKPKNYHIYKNIDVPSYLTFDFILSQNKFGQFQMLDRARKINHIPMISLEHTLPTHTGHVEYTQKLRGEINVFISEYSMEKWEWENKADTYVIPHGVDTAMFCNQNLERLNTILTVANDYIGRDYCLNFSQYKSICLDNNLPVTPVGDTPGLSKPAKDLTELVYYYNKSRIFLNTAHVSPIPTSLLEAMACGCAVVSCKTCAIPEYVEHGVNGFLANNDREMRDYLILLLEDEDLAKEMGLAASKTIAEKCSPEIFISKWNDVFNLASRKGVI